MPQVLLFPTEIALTNLEFRCRILSLSTRSGQQTDLLPWNDEGIHPRRFRKIHSFLPYRSHARLEAIQIISIQQPVDRFLHFPHNLPRYRSNRPNDTFYEKACTTSSKISLWRLALARDNRYSNNPWPLAPYETCLHPSKVHRNNHIKVTFKTRPSIQRFISHDITFVMLQIVPYFPLKS